uniref:Uncharacterized protein n=1 Tax=Rhizophagus irregularis (strain DAOM 181602 / DAOM 197198 / MUCL 43194) TaxID=747089 RepID=U9STK8_RHIID
MARSTNNFYDKDRKYVKARKPLLFLTLYYNNSRDFCNTHYAKFLQNRIIITTLQGEYDFNVGMMLKLIKSTPSYIINTIFLHIIKGFIQFKHINCKFSDNDGAGTGVDGGGDSGGRIQILFHTKLTMDPVGTSYGLTVCLTHLMNESILNALLRSCFQIYGALVREDVVVS